MVLNKNELINYAEKKRKKIVNTGEKNAFLSASKEIENAKTPHDAVTVYLEFKKKHPNSKYLAMLGDASKLKATRLKDLNNLNETLAVFRIHPKKFNSLDDIEKMIRKHGFFHLIKNSMGDFANDFELKEIKGNKVIIDHATGFMWHQSGSRPMGLKNAGKWINGLNGKRFAGFDDWRLPTAEEAASLLEPKESSRNNFPNL